MKWKTPVITLAILIACLFTVSWEANARTFESFRLKDSDGVIQLEVTSDTSGNITLDPTATGGTFDFGDMNITTSGIITAAAGTPTWSLAGSQILYPSSATVYWGVRGASNENGHIYKLDSSHMVLYNDTAADGIAFMAGGDTDDYPVFITTSNVNYLKTVGTSVLGLAPSSDLYLLPDSETDDYISYSSAGTQITQAIVGGADLIITHDTDAKGIAYQFGNDVNDYATDYTTGNEFYRATSGSCDYNILTAGAEINLKGADADDYVSVGATGNVPLFRLNGCTQWHWYLGDTDDYPTWSSSGNETLLTLNGASDFNIVTGAANYVDITTGMVMFAGDEVLDNVTADDTIDFLSDDADTTLKVTGFEAKEARFILAADQDDDATDQWQFDVDTSGVLSIGNDSTVADTFVDKLSIAAATGNVTYTGDIVTETADTIVFSNDDKISFQSNDESSTIEALGFEAKDAVLILDADQGDDNADTWLIKSEQSGNDLSVVNHATEVLNLTTAGNMQIDGTFDPTGGFNVDVVVVTDAAEYDMLVANSGKTHVIADLAQNTSIDLPAEAAGLYYKWIYVGGADEAHDHTIDSENNTNFFIGGVAFADTDAGDAADEVNAGVYSDGNSNSKLTINNASAGTTVEAYCDGTNWYITGIVVADTVCAFADQ